MIRAGTRVDAPLVTLMHYSETGESGESFDVDVQTIPWSRLHRQIDLGFPWTTSGREPDDSESGEAYDAEVRAHLMTESKE